METGCVVGWFVQAMQDASVVTLIELVKKSDVGGIDTVLRHQNNDIDSQDSVSFL